MSKAFELHRVKTLSFQSAQGKEKCVVRQLFPLEQLHSKAIHLIFMHGALEYGRRHLPLFDYLREHFKEKLLISYLDLVGHGESSGSRGEVENFNVYTLDYLSFLRTTLDTYHDHEVQTILMGHSLGGMIILSALSEHKAQLPFEIQGVILSNPCIKAKMELNNFAAKMLDGFKKHFAKLRVKNLYDGHDLTNDYHRAIAFNADPLILKTLSVSMAHAIYNYSKKLTHESYFLEHNIYFQLSDNDLIVNRKATEIFIRGINKDLVEVSSYAQTKHDLYNEKNRERVFKDVINYIEKKVSL